jgi:hypothetical protein
MCKTLAEGGKRCAAHTRPRYEAATFGTPEWDRASADYAATPSGRKALTAAQHEAEQAGDVERAVAFTHALREGERLAAAADAVRDALTAPSLNQRLTPVEDSLRTMAEELGYRRTLVRPNSDASFIGTFVFQQGTRSTEVPYTVHTEGLTVRLRSSDVTPDRDVSPLADHEFRARWDDEAALTGLTNQVRTVLERRRDPDATGTEVLAPATVDELESAFTALGHDLGYTKVRITDVNDGLSRYVDFLRPRPAKSRRIRYYAHSDGWSVRIGGYYPRLAGRPQARQGERALTVSATWSNESDSIEALNVVRDLFAALD